MLTRPLFEIQRSLNFKQQKLVEIAVVYWKSKSCPERIKDCKSSGKSGYFPMLACVSKPPCSQHEKVLLIAGEGIRSMFYPTDFFSNESS